MRLCFAWFLSLNLSTASCVTFMDTGPITLSTDTAIQARCKLDQVVF